MTRGVLEIVNETRGVPVVARGRVADNPFSRLRGLIGVHDFPAGDGLLIDPCKGIHCMFMSMAIDVLYVDGADRVVDVDEAMRPWRIGRLRGRSQYVVELPAGTVARTGTRPGDQLAVMRRAGA